MTCLTGRGLHQVWHRLMQSKVNYLTCMKAWLSIVFSRVGFGVIGRLFAAAIFKVTHED